MRTNFKLKRDLITWLLIVGLIWTGCSKEEIIAPDLALPENETHFKAGNNSGVIMQAFTGMYPWGEHGGEQFRVRCLPGQVPVLQQYGCLPRINVKVVYIHVVMTQLTSK